MKWMSWLNSSASQTAAAVAAPEVPFWPPTHVPERDKRRIEAVLDDLLRSQSHLRLHVSGGSSPLEAVVVRRDERGGMSLRVGSPLPPGARTISRFMNVTATTPTEMVMFSVNMLPGGDADQLQVCVPDEVLHLQSREFFRVRCVHGPKQSIEIRIGGDSAAGGSPRLLDLSEGGAGVLLREARAIEAGRELEGSLLLDGDVLPMGQLRVAYCIRRRDAQCRVGLQFTRMAPEVGRALRRAVNRLATSAGG